MKYSVNYLIIKQLSRIQCEMCDGKVYAYWSSFCVTFECLCAMVEIHIQYAFSFNIEGITPDTRKLFRQFSLSREFV